MNRNITFNIVRHIGTFDRTESGWTKEVNIVSWNDGPEKLDIRAWNENHTKSAKIGTITPEAARKLGEILLYKI